MADLCKNCGSYLNPDCKCQILVDRKQYEEFKMERCSGFHYCVSCEDAYPCDTDGGCGKTIQIVCVMCKITIGESKQNLEKSVDLQQMISDTLSLLDRKIFACNERINANNSETEISRILKEKYMFAMDEFRQIKSSLERKN